MLQGMIQGVGARFGVNRVAKALNGWQQKWVYGRTQALRSCKRLFPLQVAVMALQFSWQTGCTTRSCWHTGVGARSRHRARSFDT